MNKPKMKGRETLRNVKLYNQMRKSAYYNPSKRKTISDVYTRAVTPPATFRRKKVSARRSSWPPVSPLKLTRRKKYHELIKVKDFQEPFWMDTFDWLTMKHAPEKFKTVPLARISEFDEFEANLSSEISRISYKPNVAHLRKENLSTDSSVYSTKLSFYFFLNEKLKRVVEKKKYLQNLKNKCLVESVCSIKPTNFNSLVGSSDSNLSKNIANLSKADAEESSRLPREIQVASVNVENINLNDNFYAINEDHFETQDYIPFRETNHSYFTPVYRSPRPLQSYNSIESQSNVLALSSMANFENYSLKQNVAKESLKNKENIKINTYGFPDIKYPDHVESNKKHPLGPAVKKSLKGVSSFEPMRNKYNLPERFIVNESTNIGKEIHILPKDVSNKSNKQDITSYSPQDMVDPDGSEPKKIVKSDSKTETNSTSPVSSSSASVPDSQSASSVIDSQGTSSVTASQSTSSVTNSQSTGSSSSAEPNKTYLRQDIHSDFAKSSKLKKDKPEAESTQEVQEEGDTNSGNEKAKSSEAEKSAIPASVVGQSFLNTLLEQSKMISSESCIPAAVIGQSFLKTLAEQTPLVKDKPIPAEVIGQSFIKHLLSYESVSGSSVESKSIASQEKNPEVFKCTPSDSILPASVLSQAFLKSLLDSQATTESDNISDSSPESKKDLPIPAPVVGQEFLKTLMQEANKLESKSVEPKTVPASVVSQAFLKTLIDQKAAEEKSDAKGVIPATVVSQAFLKNIIGVQMPVEKNDDKWLCEQNSSNTKESGQSVIPASVVGQAFLKSLAQGQTTTSSEDENEGTVPSSVIAQTFLKSLLTSEIKSDSHLPEASNTKEEMTIPSTVLAQTFLKSLTSESQGDILTAKSPSSEDKNIQEKPSNILPSSVIGQSFLKNLIEETASKSEETLIPASVVGQMFLKTLTESETIKTEEKPSIPAPIIAQTFLKTLLEEQSAQQEKSEEKPIPSSVVGHAFLKTLLEASETQEVPKEAVIPSSVAGQIFLKTLLEEQAQESGDASKESVIPSSVVGQAFLKTLLEQAPKSQDVPEEPIIPSSVIGQAFLKTLLEQAPEHQNVPEEPVIPSSVIGQAFLKTLLEEAPVTKEVSEERVIPSSVVGQAFLKTLITERPQTSEKSPEFSETVIPSSVVGQAFLKTLIEQSPETKEAFKESPIPSSVIGQTFLKTLIEGTPQIEEAPKEPVMSSSVISQVFLKSLLEQTPQTSEEPKELVIPSSVIGQTFLKALVKDTAEVPEASQDQVLPSSVVSQIFLKSLLSESGTVSDIQTLSPSDSPSDKGSAKSVKTLLPVLQKDSVPASVVGLAFLKTLTEQSEISKPVLEESFEKTESNTIPASVVGQAFIKTLFAMSNQSDLGSSSVGESSNNELCQGTETKTLCKNGSDSSSDGTLLENVSESLLFDVQSNIIPPPPEFSGESAENVIDNSLLQEASTSKADLPSSIIEELLSCTKVMESVIENLKENESQHSNLDTSPKSDICKKDKL